MAENERHLKEIGKLKAAADRSTRWAEKSENRKIGFDPVKENDRSVSTRAYIGAKTKKMQARVRAYEKRVEREIEEKEGLLQDIEETVDLKIKPLKYHKDILVNVRDLSLRYGEEGEALFDCLRFQVRIHANADVGSISSHMTISFLPASLLYANCTKNTMLRTKINNVFIFLKTEEI